MTDWVEEVEERETSRMTAQFVFLLKRMEF